MWVFLTTPSSPYLPLREISRSTVTTLRDTGNEIPTSLREFSKLLLEHTVAVKFWIAWKWSFPDMPADLQHCNARSLACRGIQPLHFQSKFVVRLEYDICWGPADFVPASNLWCLLLTPLDLVTFKNQTAFHFIQRTQRIRAPRGWPLADRLSSHEPVKPIALVVLL